MDIPSYVLGKKAGGGVQPTGTINITENGITNVSSYATADVNVQPDLESKSETITTNTTTTITPSQGKDGLSSVEITTNVLPNLESKEITITENTTTLIQPTSGKDGLSQVSVITNVSGGGSSYAPTYGISFNTNFQTSGTDTTTTSLDFTGLDTSNMTSMRKMFCNMRALTSLNLSTFDTSNVTDMNNMFYYCSALASIIFGNNWDTSNVENMSNMFQRCTNLTSLNLSNWDTSKVTSMINMFNNTGTSGTLSITYGNGWDTSKVTNMSNMFQGISNTTLDLSNYDTSSVTNMSNMFNGCTNLSSLTYGNNWNTDNVANMQSMFNGCTALVNIDLSKYNFTSTLDNINTMFNGCTALEKITFGKVHNKCNPSNKTNIYQNCSNLKEIVINEFIDDQGYGGSDYVWSIFEPIKNQIEKLTINEAISIDSSFKFSDMTNLKTLILGNIDFTSSSLKSLVGLFLSNKALTSLDVRTVKTANCTNFSDVFRNCWALNNITFGPNFNTADATTFATMFYDCRALTSLDLSNFNTKKVINMTYMFGSCGNLETITFGNDWSFESITNQQVGLSGIFSNCTKLDNNTLNAILGLCTTAPADYNTKTLAHLGITSSFDNFANIPNLSNYQAFIDAGWTIS